MAGPNEIENQPNVEDTSTVGASFTSNAGNVAELNTDNLRYLEDITAESIRKVVQNADVNEIKAGKPRFYQREDTELAYMELNTDADKIKTWNVISSNQYTQEIFSSASADDLAYSEALGPQ